MRRSVLTALAVLGTASPALAQEPGGAAAPADTISTAKAGGVTPGAGSAPVARLSARARAGRPRIRVRFDEPGVSAVVARVVVLRSPDNSVVTTMALGSVRTGATITVPWRRGALPAGRYVVRVHARDRWNNQLARSDDATGKATFAVRAHADPPASAPPASAPPAPPPSSPPPSSSGVFPVAGPVTYGDGMGAGRGHQGQDMAAAAGTPVVAPVGGTIAKVAYQEDGAGQYVVLDGSDGRSYFFAHNERGSVPVDAGDTVTAGALIARIGSSGRSTGPHLHFEIWVGGWRASAKSAPIDPLSQLRAWAA